MLLALLYIAFVSTCVGYAVGGWRMRRRLNPQRVVAGARVVKIGGYTSKGPIKALIGPPVTAKEVYMGISDAFEAEYKKLTVADLPPPPPPPKPDPDWDEKVVTWFCWKAAYKIKREEYDEMENEGSPLTRPLWGQIERMKEDAESYERSFVGNRSHELAKVNRFVKHGIEVIEKNDTDALRIMVKKFCDDRKAEAKKESDAHDQWCRDNPTADMMSSMRFYDGPERCFNLYERN